jgi:AcrR family transcriptional regulator
MAELEQPESLTLRHVAREVGVAPASIYSHFDDLGSLFDHVLTLRYAELVDLMKVANQEATPLGRLATWCAIYVHWGIDHPGEYRTLFGGRAPAGVTPPAHHEGLQLLEATTGALADVIDVDRSLLPTQRAQAGILLWTAMHGVISAIAEHQNVAWPPVDSLIAGIVALHTSTPQDAVTAVLAAGR